MFARFCPVGMMQLASDHAVFADLVFVEQGAARHVARANAAPPAERHRGRFFPLDPAFDQRVEQQITSSTQCTISTTCAALFMIGPVAGGFRPRCSAAALARG